jgi:Trypsin-co-occurring domain 1
MERYLRFTDKDGSSFLVEIDEKEVLSSGGIEKAGIKDSVKELGEKVVVTAQELFEDAVDNLIQRNTRAFLQAIRKLPQQDQPKSLEVTFAIKATGEIGNAAIAKGTGEANYTVKINWER